MSATTANKNTIEGKLDQLIAEEKRKNKLIKELIFVIAYSSEKDMMAPISYMETITSVIERLSKM